MTKSAGIWGDPLYVRAARMLSQVLDKHIFREIQDLRIKRKEEEAAFFPIFLSCVPPSRPFIGPFRGRSALCKAMLIFFRCFHTFRSLFPFFTLRGNYISLHFCQKKKMTLMLMSQPHIKYHLIFRNQGELQIITETYNR